MALRFCDGFEATLSAVLGRERCKTGRTFHLMMENYTLPACLLRLVPTLASQNQSFLPLSHNPAS